MNKGVTAVIVVVVLIAVAAWFYAGRKAEVTAPPQTREVAVPPPAPEQAEPAVRHPIDEVRVAAEKRQMPEAGREPLPALEDSDAPLREDLSGLFDAGALKTFVFDHLIRRIVVTVDNLPRKKLPQKDRFVADVPGQFKVAPAQAEDTYILSGENYARYRGFVELAESVDLEKLAVLYTRYYPLFQQAYEDLGYPDRYFNDRLVEVIGHLLAAPELRGTVRLVRPKVFYQFADPGLEKLSAGQKIMIRMGPENERRVKIVLRELLRRLVKS
jgi:hypothetical protein